MLILYRQLESSVRQGPSRHLSRKRISRLEVISVLRLQWFVVRDALEREVLLTEEMCVSPQGDGVKKNKPVLEEET